MRTGLSLLLQAVKDLTEMHTQARSYSTRQTELSTSPQTRKFESIDVSEGPCNRNYPKGTTYTWNDTLGVELAQICSEYLKTHGSI